MKRAAVTCSPLADHRPPAWPGEGEGATLTSVPVGGFVKHQHGVIHLKQPFCCWRTHQTPGTPDSPEAEAAHPRPYRPARPLSQTCSQCRGPRSSCHLNWMPQQPPFHHQILKGSACR